jgi:hypothetical protein
MPSDGVRLIAEERERQITREGWDEEHDDEHTDNELAVAAACYAMPRWHKNRMPARWPWDREWWKPGDRIRELSKAGALIAAEIDRLLRARAEAAQETES